MNHNFSLTLDYVNRRSPTDGTGGIRRTPTDGTGGIR